MQEVPTPPLPSAPLPSPLACMALLLLSLFESALLLAFLPCYDALGVGIDCRSSSSSCGSIQNITCPFRLQSDPPQDCGNSNFQLTCENNNRTVFYWDQKRYYVQDIDYHETSIRIIDPGLLGDNCSYLPSYPQITENSPYYYYDDYSFGPTYYDIMDFLKCSVPVNDSLRYVPIAPCSNNSSSGGGGGGGASSSYSYVLLGPTSVMDLHSNCSVVSSVPLNVEELGGDQNLTSSSVRHLLLAGVKLYGFGRLGRICSQPPNHDDTSGILDFLLRAVRTLLQMLMASIQTLGYILLGRTSLGMLCLSVLLIYKLRRKHLAVDDGIEEFLSQYKNQMPTRYSFWGIRRMTNLFKEKLGQGGFGSVFKGSLPNGRLVAVKLLGKAKGCGRDFINEVATIGRIHHVNVVQLMGFCSEGSKTALIYEFMPNGSLDKYLFAKKEMIINPNPLSWDKLYDIALGTARGIEYLHQGCDMKILHFDIKPHNILLDDNFIPKVSDFGLAKLYPIEDSIVSVTAVRGTIGYIAPELFYRKVGNVSYKSDVYSYGMLLMEMAGMRKNVDPHADHSSQIYFPSWVYDQLDGGGDMGMSGSTDDERSIAKKLTIVGLWCIQMRPTDRPSMSRVVEMLEGSTEHLEMPPKPFLSSPPGEPEPELTETSTEPLDHSPSQWPFAIGSSSMSSTEPFQSPTQGPDEDQAIAMDSDNIISAID